jgi:ADP-ribose pyrophosphatase YjhB (NUDIX family)
MSESEVVLVWLLIESEGSVLVAKRKPDEPPFAGGWTLPGDELRKGQSPSSFIALFGRDELDVQIMGDEPFQTLRIDDGDEEYAVAIHRVGFEGRPRFRESGPYSEMGWAPRDELLDESTFPFLAKIASYLDGPA